MNFVAQVEDHLRDLGAEARKNHPGVKEASERAIINLRSLQTQYVAAVRRAGASTKQNDGNASAAVNDGRRQRKAERSDCPPSQSPAATPPPRHPTTALFRSQDVLRPFLLAANHPDASTAMLTIALESIQHLLRGDAVCPEDGIQVCRVLVIQSWGCARTLGLGGGVGGNNGQGGDNNGGGSAFGSTAGSVAAGVIGLASSSVSGALGGLTGMMMGGGGGGGSGNDTTDSSSASAAGPNNGGHQGHHQHQHHQHNPSRRSVKDDQSIALKILQTCIVLVDSRSVRLTKEAFGSCLLLCLLLGAASGENANAGGGGQGGGTIRERLAHTASAANVAAVGGGKDGGGAGGTGNVKRAAVATMNQLLSILCERARDAMTEQRRPPDDATGDAASLLSVAERTIADLCCLVKRKDSTSQSRVELAGPFAVAAKEGLLPSPTTSLALIDMMLKQICGDMFCVCFDFYGPNDDATISTTNPGVDFATKCTTQAFQLAQSLLGGQYCYHVTKFTLESSLKEDSKPSHQSNLVDFCMYYYTTSMTTSILKHYLSATSELFYGNFDANATLAEHSNNPREKATSVSRMALDIIKQLISFIDEATESYHKSADFEDGYIFTQSERESFDIGKVNSASDTRTQSTARAGARGSSPETLPLSSISDDTLWRAYLSLEVIYSVVPSHLEQISWLDSIGRDDSNDKFTATLIAQSASDFATISASNRDSILHLLVAAYADHESTKSTVADTEATNSNELDAGKQTAQASDSENSNAAAAVAAKVTDSMVIDSIETPLCNAGATTWLAFKAVLLMVKSLKELAVCNEGKDGSGSPLVLCGLINGLFTPSVSMLQHFIRRMLGSPIIVTHTLDGYKELAFASMSVDSQSTNVRRQAILMSLCKLCLPSWGKKRPNCQLKESNIDSLMTLLWIVHRNYEKISGEWGIILSTLDQLSIISISSPKLHDSHVKKAVAIAGCFTRLPAFTTCFTKVALSQFIRSLVKMSEADSFQPLSEQNNDFNRRSSDVSLDSTADSPYNEKGPSIGGRLASLAGRAFGGGPAQSSSSNNAISSAKNASPGASASSFSDELRQSACLQTGSTKFSTPQSVIRKIPLSLLLIAVVTEANSYRLPVIEEVVAEHLLEIVAKSSSTELQSFAMEVVTNLMPQSMQSKSQISLKYGSGPLMIPNEEDENEVPLEVIPVDIPNEPELLRKVSENNVDGPPEGPQLFKILCHTIQLTPQAEIANNTLNTLNVLLEGSGHSLSGENLITVIKTMSVLSGMDASKNGTSVDRSTKQWANVSAQAFNNLKRILDDFLEPVTPSSDSPLKSTAARDAILDCCVAFGRSRHDLNTSLTATGMLWSLADRDASPDTVDIVLSKLAFLAMDDRPELRNCSVNTLFSCVDGLGGQFTDTQWKICFNDTIFGIMQGITSAIKDGQKDADINGNANDERYKVAVHHSRNSSRKQWAATQILILRGLSKIIRLFFSQLLETLSNDSNETWFLHAWKEVLQISFDSVVTTGEREVLDMRLVGVELLVLCAQLSSASGINAAITAARVGTNMEVVGGALRSVRAAVEDKVADADKTSLQSRPEVNQWRQQLFDLSFDKLCEFSAHLEQSHGEKDDDASCAVDSLLTQVLTKITGQLANLYECCKNDEMTPGDIELQLDISIENEAGGYESRFLYLLLSIANNSGIDQNARYLNQVQRGVMSLLRSMASNSSLRAFKALATISGDFMFTQPTAISSDGSDDHGEKFELEAAKMVASAFESDDLSNEAKVVVMCSVLLQYLKIYGNHPEDGNNGESQRTTSGARYDIITSVLDSGLKATEIIDANTDEKDILDSIWDRIIATVSSLLLPPLSNRYDGYAHHSKAILNIVAIVLLHMPARKLPLAEPMLQNGADRAVEVAFECNEKKQEDGDVPYAQAAEGAVHVFLSCFMGLCQKIPACPAVRSLTDQILGDTIDSMDPLSETAVLHAKTRQSLAIAVCESLRTSTSQDLLVGVFPLLCRLTNVENDGLRRAAGRILGGINLSEAISRERQRAEQADVRAREIEEENVAMLEEIEYLQAENDELQRQKAQTSCEACKKMRIPIQSSREGWQGKKNTETLK